MYASIDLVIDKLEAQIRTINGSRVTRKRQGLRAGKLASQS